METEDQTRYHHTPDQRLVAGDMRPAKNVAQCLMQVVIQAVVRHGDKFAKYVLKTKIASGALNCFFVLQIYGHVSKNLPINSEYP